MDYTDDNFFDQFNRAPTQRINQNNRSSSNGTLEPEHPGRIGRPYPENDPLYGRTNNEIYGSYYSCFDSIDEAKFWTYRRRRQWTDPAPHLTDQVIQHPEPWVRQLYDAMKDRSEILDNMDSNQAKSFWKERKYTEKDIIARCWEVVVSAMVVFRSLRN